MDEIGKNVLRWSYYWAEPYFLGITSLTCLGLKFNRKQLLFYSCIFGTVVLGIREFLIPIFGWPQGIQSFYMVLINVSLLVKFFKLKVSEAIFANIIFFTTLITVESVTLGIIQIIHPNVLEAIINKNSSYWQEIRILNLLILCLMVSVLKKQTQILIPIHYIIERHKNGES